MFNKLFAICLLVDDFEKSFSFYRDKLGLKVNSQEGKFADFKLGETSLAIFGKDEAVTVFPRKFMKSGGGAVIGFQVKDVDKTCDELRKKGVEIFEGPKTTEWGQEVAYFLDPDGNIWEIKINLRMTKSVRLNEHKVVSLVPKSPFSFDPTFHKPAHYPTSDNAWQSGIRWQTMLWEGECLGLKFENKGQVKTPKINLHIFSQKKLSEDYLDPLIKEIRYRYDLDVDLSEFVERFKDDPQLGLIIKKWPGMRPLNYSSLYEYLVIGIMLQNCTVRRSVKMTQTLFEKYGTLLRYDGKELFCYWRPEILDKASEEELRALKVGYRAKSLKRISEAFAKKEVDELELRKKSKEEQREVLLSLYGIGPATVGYILFDVFQHYDELNHISPWEQKIYSKLFFNREPENPVSVEKLLKLFDRRFGKYKMLAVHYIWEDLWWKRKQEKIPWLEKMIRL